ncbi:hypothetical protein LTR85_005311 [Meristemomyces frigidus]|nr:hypothetical protein LTR85_005311 [Meristemomyces frigidus]
MEKSPLSTLPPELRVIIYDFALTYPDPIGFKHRHAAGDSKVIARTTLPTYPIALTQTCAQIRSECEDTFFRQNKFIVHVVGFPSCLYSNNERVRQNFKRVRQTFKRVRQTFKPLETFIATIGSNNAAVVPSVTTDLGEVTTNEIRRTASHYAIDCTFRDCMAAAKRYPRQKVRLRVQVVVGSLTPACEPLSVVVDVNESALSLEKARDDMVDGIELGKWIGLSGGQMNALWDVMQDWEDLAKRIGQEA